MATRESESSMSIPNLPKQSSFKTLVTMNTDKISGRGTEQARYVKKLPKHYNKVLKDDLSFLEKKRERKEKRSND